jgi:hypothetical protein
MEDPDTVEIARRILRDPNATEWNKTNAREVIADFLDGKEESFAWFAIPDTYEEKKS